MAFLDEVAARMVIDGVESLLPEGQLVVGEYVEARDDLVVLYETGSPGPGIRVQEARGIRYVDQGGQVIVRALTYEAAKAKVQQVWTWFNGRIRNEFLGGIYYLILEAITSPAFLQRDGQSRFYFFFNFHALKEPS